MISRGVVGRSRRLVRTSLLSLLVMFSAAAIAFSLFVVFNDLGHNRSVSPSEARGMFTTFVYDYLNDVHPQKPAAGSAWSVTNFEFKNNNLAIVDATDGTTRTKLEFIYVIEAPNVRVLTINDITGRDLEDARLALLRYLNFLHDMQYDGAAQLYGGAIAKLLPYGTEADADNRASLFKGYCETVTPTGTCLLFSIHDAARDPATGAYTFIVRYLLPDGSTFALSSGKQNFSAIVEDHGAGQFVVLTLPFD